MSQQRADPYERDALRDRRWRMAADLFVSTLVALSTLVVTALILGFLFVAGGCSTELQGSCSTRFQDNLTDDDITAMTHLVYLVSFAVGAATFAVKISLRRRAGARNEE